MGVNHVGNSPTRRSCSPRRRAAPLRQTLHEAETGTLTNALYKPEQGFDRWHNPNSRQ
jgi:hypothetical protein